MLQIKSRTESNENYNASKINNGGGYHQPRYVFEFNGKEGAFDDTSCGDFGTRYDVVLNGECIYYQSLKGIVNTILDSRNEGNLTFIKEFYEAFSVKLKTWQEL